MDHHVSGWDARLMKRPGDEAVLTVTGECKLPATFRAVLNLAETQGEDPSQLVLDLMINIPSGKPPTKMETLATLNVSLKMPTEEIYTSVKIADINADPETEEATVWEVPVKLIDWSNAPARLSKSERRKAATTGSQQGN